MDICRTHADAAATRGTINVRRGDVRNTLKNFFPSPRYKTNSSAG